MKDVGYEVKTVCRSSDNEVRVSIWLGEDTQQGDRIRHDAIHLKLERETGDIDAIAHADFGLPVLQPHQVEFDIPGGIRNQLLQETTDGRWQFLFAQVLALTALSELTNYPLSEKAEKTQNSALYDAGLLEFQRLAATSLSGSSVPFGAPAKSSAAISVSCDVARFGIDIGLLRRRDASLTLHRQVAVQLNTSLSALSAVQKMEEDRVDLGIVVPSGFQNIDRHEAETALFCLKSPSATAVSYYGDLAADAHRNRMQAASSYPLLAGFMVEIPAIRDAIDNSEKLVPLLVKSTGLNKGVLRRLGKIKSPLPSGRELEFMEFARDADQIGIERARSLSVSTELSLARLLRILAALDVSWVPTSEEDWQCFLDIVSACALPISSVFDIPVEEILKPSKGNWKAFQNSLATAVQMPVKDLDRRQLALVTIDALLGITDFGRTVMMPQVMASIQEVGETLPPPIAADLFEVQMLAFRLVTGRNRNVAVTLFGFARRWMSRIPALSDIEMRASSKEKNTQAPWARKNRPRLVEDYTASNGLLVTNLVSSRELTEESSRLSHCVGRLYQRKSRKCDCHIFSVRTPDGCKSLSTFELNQPEAEIEQLARKQLSVVQHKGYRNRKPSACAKSACEELINELKAGRVPMDFSKVWNWRAKVTAHEIQKKKIGQPGSPEAWADRLGFAWQEGEVRKEIWHEWQRHILSGPTSRARNPGIIYTDPDVREFVARLNPVAAALLAERATAQ